jgi:hypothetical protein
MAHTATPKRTALKARSFQGFVRSLLSKSELIKLLVVVHGGRKVTD